MNNKSKTYIIICGIYDVVAGGPIYHSNKIRFMEENGWNVIVIPTNPGKKIFIQGFQRFDGPFFPYSLDMPNEFSRHQQKKIIDLLESFVPVNQEEIIIETGTDYTAYWGECLAKRIGARHFVIFLDEQNPNVDEKVIDFYKFKYFRHELACISQPVMQHLFKDYMSLSLEQCFSLPCCCHNSLSDYSHPLLQLIQSNKMDYNIGYIGRLEKDFLPAILNGIKKFALSIPERTILFCCFGGAFEEKTKNNIINFFKEVDNIKLLISGYIFPMPLQALRQMDVFVAGAGSSVAGAKTGVPTVRVDILSYEPIGLHIDYTFNHLKKCPFGNKIEDYLRWILISEKMPHKTAYNTELEWKNICERFKLHLNFIAETTSEKQYYDTEKLGISNKRKWKRFFRTVLGLYLYEQMHELHRRYLVWRHHLPQEAN